jgi:hypothetical protein
MTWQQWFLAEILCACLAALCIAVAMEFRAHGIDVPMWLNVLFILCMGGMIVLLWFQPNQ